MTIKITIDGRVYEIASSVEKKPLLDGAILFALPENLPPTRAYNHPDIPVMPTIPYLSPMQRENGSMAYPTVHANLVRALADMFAAELRENELTGPPTLHIDLQAFEAGLRGFKFSPPKTDAAPIAQWDGSVEITNRKEKIPQGEIPEIPEHTPRFAVNGSGTSRHRGFTSGAISPVPGRS